MFGQFLRNAGVLVCPSDYDGYLCWNHARAGTRVSHSCRAVSSPVLFTENEHGTRHSMLPNNDYLNRKHTTTVCIVLVKSKY